MGENKVQDRSTAAIRNRWINTIQKALLKFSACMNKALSEYHSGWSFEDYMAVAKKYYLSETGKQFLHELSWLEVKQLPKFAISTENMSKDIKRALDLDQEPESNPSEQQEPERTAPASTSSNRSVRMTPRPAFGKKTGKKLKFESKADENESSWKELYLKNLVQGSEEKNKIQRDRYYLALFALNPESEESKRYLKLKQEDAMVEAEIQLARKRKHLLNIQTETNTEEAEAIDDLIAKADEF